MPSFIDAYNSHLRNATTISPKTGRKRGQAPIVIGYKGAEGKLARRPISPVDEQVCTVMQKVIESNAKRETMTPLAEHITRIACDELLKLKGLSVDLMKIRMACKRVSDYESADLIPPLPGSFPEGHSPPTVVRHAQEYLDYLDACIALKADDSVTDWVNMQLARVWPEQLSPPIPLLVNKRCEYPPKTCEDSKLIRALYIIYISYSLPIDVDRYALIKQLIRNIRKNCVLDESTKQYIDTIYKSVRLYRFEESDYSSEVQANAIQKLESYAHRMIPVRNYHSFLSEVEELTAYAICQLGDVRFISASFLPLDEAERLSWDMALEVLCSPDASTEEKISEVKHLECIPADLGNPAVYDNHMAFLFSIKDLLERVAATPSAFKRRALDDTPLAFDSAAGVRADFSSIDPNRIFSLCNGIVMMDIQDSEEQLDYIVAYVASGAHPSLSNLKEAAARKIKMYKLEEYVPIAIEYISKYLPQNTSISAVDEIISRLEVETNIVNKLRLKIDLAVVQCILQSFKNPDFVKPASMESATESSGFCSLPKDSDYAVYLQALFGFYTVLLDPDNTIYNSIAEGSLNFAFSQWMKGETFRYAFAQSAKETSITTYLSNIREKRPDIHLDTFKVEFIHYLESSGMTQHITKIPVEKDVDLSIWTEEDFDTLPGSCKRRGILFHNAGYSFMPADKCGNYSLQFLVYKVADRHMLLTRDRENGWHLFDPAGDLGFGFPLNGRFSYLGRGDFEEVLRNSSDLSVGEISEGFVAALYA